MRRIIVADDDGNYEDWELLKEGVVNNDEEGEDRMQFLDTSNLHGRRKPKILAWGGDFQSAVASGEEEQDQMGSNYAGDRLNRLKVTNNRTNNKETRFITSIGSRLFFYFRSYYRCLCLAFIFKGSFSAEILIFTIASLQSFYTDIFRAGKGINTALILLLGASIHFKKFPANFVRPQVCIALLVLSSIGVDVVNCMLYGFTSSQLTGIIFISIFKIGLLISMLYNTNESSRRARKYLIRRFRLFGLSCQQPQRIMRDVRARLLAIGWIQLFASIYYVICGILSFTMFDYSIYYLSHNFPWYLFVKGFLSFLLFLGVLYDTDIVLCLWYFGCLSFNLKYVQRYISKKYIELGGWPLAFSFYSLRFSILKWFKVFDFIVGLYGWAILAPVFTPDFFTRETKLQTFLMFVVFVQLATDVWCPLLFYMIVWLLRRRKLLKLLELLEVSDDSEIDEFDLKEDMAIARRRMNKGKKTITVGMDPNAVKSSIVRKATKPAPSTSLLKPSRSKKLKHQVHPDYLNSFDPFESYSRRSGSGQQYQYERNSRSAGERLEDDEKEDAAPLDRTVFSPLRKTWTV